MTPRIRHTFEILVLAGLYVLLGRLGLGIEAGSGFATLVSPPTGISIAALLLYGPRLWPGIFLGAVVINASIGGSIPVALSIGAGNTIEAILAVHVLQRLGFPNSFDRLWDVLIFVVAGALPATLVSATVGVASLSLGGQLPGPGLSYTWLAWWVGDMMAALTLTPLILAWHRPGDQALTRRLLVEGVLLLVILFCIAELNFADWFRPGLAGYIRPYWIFPVLIWASIRFGPRGATAAIFLLSVVAIWFASSGSGPFNGGTLSDRLIELQLFMGVVAITTLCLAAVSAERRLAIEWLREARDELEKRVRTRTLELTEANRMLSEAQQQAHIGSWEWDLVSGKINWSDELYAIFGLDPRRFDGTYETYLGSIHPEDRASVANAVGEAARTGEPFSIEHRVLLPDGALRSVHGEGKVFKSPSGAVVRMAGTAQDVTERVSAARNIQLLNAELEQRVLDRTAELEAANRALAHENAERTSMEETLFLSRERYRGFFENSPISLWEEDFSEVKRAVDALKGSGVTDVGAYLASHPGTVSEFAAKVRVLDANRATLELYGAASKEELLAGLDRVLSPGSYDVFRQEIAAIAGGATVFEAEDINTTFSGRPIDIHLKWSVAPGFEISYSKVLVSIIDITEQKRIEKQIRLLAQALESTTEMICITNLENCIIFANRAFLGTYGYAEEEILGKAPTVLHPQGVSADLAREIFELSRSQGWSGELLNRRKDGSEFPVYLSTSPIRDGAGNVLGLIGVARDISEITRAERVLWEAASMIEKLYEAPAKEHAPMETDPAKRKHDLAQDISEVVGKLHTRARQTLSFSSLASHQLRTPLTILRSQLENALRPELSAVSLRRTLSSTYDEILHLSHIVDVLLSLSRMQAGTLQLDFRSLDFQRLMNEFHREVCLLALEKSISVVLKPGPPVSIQADPDQLRQVLLNLLDNAIKYTPPKGRIAYEYRVEGTELVLEVSNSGEGIAPELLLEIFNPFRSGEPGNHVRKGAGLGLALVKWIVESHRGSVGVRSLPGKSTTFIVRLPVRQNDVPGAIP